MEKIWKGSVGLYSKKNNEFSSFSWTGRNWEVLLGQHSKIPKSLKSQTTISKDFIGRNDNGIMQYTPDFKKCLLSFVGRLCKICFPTFCYMLSPLYINLIANYCRRNKATPCCNLVFILHNETVVFWNIWEKFWFVLKKSFGF